MNFTHFFVAQEVQAFGSTSSPLRSLLPMVENSYKGVSFVKSTTSDGRVHPLSLYVLEWNPFSLYVLEWNRLSKLWPIGGHGIGKGFVNL